MKTTNVKPNELNYDRYTMNKYDRDIVNSIPYHKEIHQHIIRFLEQKYKKNDRIQVLDLGVGTGITSAVIRRTLPNCHIDAVDFSEQMLNHAKQKLGKKGNKYILGDYSTMSFQSKYDIVVSVIGIHHQTHAGKRKLFKKVAKLLNPQGVFIFGDLVTYKNKKAAAFNQALHFHHLVKNTKDSKTLTEWAYHHQFQNILAPLEDQTQWLQDVGFAVEQSFFKMNTALLVCTKKK